MKTKSRVNTLVLSTEFITSARAFGWVAVMLLCACWTPSRALSLVAVSSETNGLYCAVFADSPSRVVTTNHTVFAERELSLLIVSTNHMKVSVFLPTDLSCLHFAQLIDASGAATAPRDHRWQASFERVKAPSDVKLLDVESATEVPVFQGQLRGTPLVLGRPDTLFRIEASGEYIMKMRVQIFVRAENGRLSLLKLPPVQFRVIKDL